MPLYEYTCLFCHKRFTVLVGMTAQADSTVCPHCGHDQSQRRVSRFAKGRTEEDRLESLSNPDALDAMDDPKALRRWASDIGDEMGEDLGDDFDQYLEEGDDGEIPSGPFPDA